MGWSLGYDSHWRRDIGYGVPAICDQPSCEEEIDRGLAHVCGGEPYGGDKGCGLYFCGKHLRARYQRCQRCVNRNSPFTPKPDVREWIDHKMSDASWATWREENPQEVAALVSAGRKALEDPRND